jgi:hypothetical protein
VRPTPRRGGVGRVEGGGGLVEEQGLGVAQERARDGHALLLPARQSDRVAIEELRVEAHLFHRGGEARFREIARRARGADSQVAPHRALEEHRRLHHQRGALAQIARIERADVAPVEAHAAARRLGETVETAEQGGLARARGAEEDEGAAALHRHRHVFEDSDGWLATPSVMDERELLDLEERMARGEGGRPCVGRA